MTMDQLVGMAKKVRSTTDPNILELVPRVEVENRRGFAVYADQVSKLKNEARTYFKWSAHQEPVWIPIKELSKLETKQEA